MQHSLDKAIGSGLFNHPSALCGKKRRNESKRKKEGEGFSSVRVKTGRVWLPGCAVRQGSPGAEPGACSQAPAAVVLHAVPVHVRSTKEQVWLQSQTNERLLQCFFGHLMNNHAATVLSSQPVLSSAAEAAAPNSSVGTVLARSWRCSCSAT